MDLEFRKLTKPTAAIARQITKWENDPALIPFTRPNRDQAALDLRKSATVEDLRERLEHRQIYLMYLQKELVGEMDFQVDPIHLYKKETGTAWVGITIGEEAARGRGIGALAMQYLEEQIEQHGLKRIELGVFEFNTSAIKLYQKLGYREIARIDNFAFWQGKMWQDIRMEKYISQGAESSM